MKTISKEQRAEVIREFGENENDTGSTTVQIALLTARLTVLTEHFKTHKKDHHSRRGLLRIVAQRKSLLSFLLKKDIEKFRSIKKQLGIR